MSKSYAYFTLVGDDFDPDQITKKLSIDPTSFWRKGDKLKYKSKAHFTMWEISSKKRETLLIDNLVSEVVKKLYSKIGLINDLKKELKLKSIFRIVMYIDINSKASTPALGHSIKTIKFLDLTTTPTDVDIQI